MHDPQITPSEQKLISELSALAVDHDAECEDALEHEKDCPERECYDHRLHLVARLCVALGLSLVDLGFVAREIIDIESEIPDGPHLDEPDEVLEARVLDFQ